MSNRRMFNKQIIYRFDFVRMSDAAQKLYQYLIFEADDDGFVGNPERVVAMANVSEKNYDELKECGFVHEFRSGVCVIIHWLHHNSVLRDGYLPTKFRGELAQIRVAGGEYQPIQKEEEKGRGGL